MFAYNDSSLKNIYKQVVVFVFIQCTVWCPQNNFSSKDYKMLWIDSKKKV